jgi:hypothetical protein
VAAQCRGIIMIWAHSLWGVRNYVDLITPMSQPRTGYECRRCVGSLRVACHFEPHVAVPPPTHRAHEVLYPPSQANEIIGRPTLSKPPPRIVRSPHLSRNRERAYHKKYGTTQRTVFFAPWLPHNHPQRLKERKKRGICAVGSHICPCGPPEFCTVSVPIR